MNGSKSGTWLLVEHAGALYAPRDAFEEWRVVLDPKVLSIGFKGQDYWPLAAVPGYQSKVNFANQSLELLFSPQAFAATRLAQEQTKKLTLSPVLPSLFFNYDLNYQHTELRAAPALQDSGILTELGFSSNLGILTNTTLGRNLTNSTTLGNARRLVRLETTFTKDFPDSNLTLRLGDTATRTSLLGLSVYYGGIQFGTNYGLSPGFVSQPVPILTGISAVPSTVDLYVNDVLRQTSNIPTGPFAIDNFPALTGGGEARLVVRDLLGRETVITQSFFTHNSLLAAGLNDWSVGAGSVRRDLGIKSADYGPSFARGLWRHGLTNQLTVEGTAVASSSQNSVELGLVAALPWQWLGTLAGATSHLGRLGNGSQWLLGLEKQGLRNSIFLQAQGATINFRQLGQPEELNPVQQQLAGNWTYSSERFGSFGIGFASMKPFLRPTVNTASANYSINLGERASLSFTASKSQGGFNGTSVGMNLVVPLENNRVASASATRTGGQSDAFAAVTQNPTADDNLGWRVLAGQQQSRPRAEGGLVYFGRYGNYFGDVSVSPDQSAVRLSANGGLVLTDGHLFATRRLDQSFALAEVPGYANVGVGLGSTMLTRTDANGLALIPQLVPYQTNSVRLDPADLPVSAEIDSIEQGAVPAWRSVVKVTFPVRTGRGALLRITLDDGDVAPAGAIVQIEGDKDKQEFYVARRGEAFVTGLQASNRVVLKWNKQQCTFDVMLPPESPDQIARVGPLLCKGIKR